ADLCQHAFVNGDDSGRLLRVEGEYWCAAGLEKRVVAEMAELLEESLRKDAEEPGRGVLGQPLPFIRNEWVRENKRRLVQLDDLVGIFHPVPTRHKRYLIKIYPSGGHRAVWLSQHVYQAKDIEMAHLFLEIGRQPIHLVLI